MKYLKIVSPQTNLKGDFAILRNEKVYLLNTSPVTGMTKETGVSFSIKEVKTFLPPVDPPNIIALGLNYKEHAKESSMELPPAPVIFLKSTSSITGHLQSIILPEQAPDEVDYEGELCVIIGKLAKMFSLPL
ncbi:MAG: fumarylacetoacetate hydrolase family protein [Candidatus Omnitrophica bacterium]|nr:fumarylacetoacetate hydrolase family protein [Candidatus Omnitrophota bacterium]